MSSVTAIRITVVLLGAVALAFTFLSLFLNLFTISTSYEIEYLKLEESLSNSTFNATSEAGIAMVRRFYELQTLPSKSSTFTMWKANYEYITGTKQSFALQNEYFACEAGQRNIQLVQGIAVVAAVLGAMNIVMSLFLFNFSAVVKFPLAIYFFLSAATAGVSFAMLLHLFLNGWCDEAALKTNKWVVSIGFVALPISMVLSFVSAILSILAH